jgi:hypothetical protein
MCPSSRGCGRGSGTPAPSRCPRHPARPTSCLRGVDGACMAAVAPRTAAAPEARLTARSGGRASKHPAGACARAPATSRRGPTRQRVARQVQHAQRAQRAQLRRDRPRQRVALQRQLSKVRQVACAAAARAQSGKGGAAAAASAVPCVAAVGTDRRRCGSRAAARTEPQSMNAKGPSPGARTELGGQRARQARAAEADADDARVDVARDAEPAACNVELGACAHATLRDDGRATAPGPRLPLAAMARARTRVQTAIPACPPHPSRGWCRSRSVAGWTR